MDPLRRRLLGALTDGPDSASGLARRFGMPRQKLNYHLREMEKAGLLRLVEERKKGNCTERVVQAVATHYLISPELLGELGPEPERVRDRFSWGYLVAVASKAIRELAVLRRRADAVNKPLQTLTLQTEVRFSCPAHLNEFSEELSNAVAGLAAKYHNEQAPQGRLFRFFVGAYPAITKTEEEARAEADAAARAPGAKGASA
ncbi:MAG TPA: transcriptional regulator [Phycisphaerales bacterium]|nr:transcriptional regulator [Phycisphaerales bacterium]